MESSSLIIPLMLAAMALFMFVSIRGQKKRAAAAAEMQSAVGPGSRVQLHCGLFGVVVDASDSDVVQIEIAPGVVTEWNRMAIREAVADTAEAADDFPATDAADDFEVPDTPEGIERLGDEQSDGDAGDDKPGEK